MSFNNMIVRIFWGANTWGTDLRYLNLKEADSRDGTEVLSWPGSGSHDSQINTMWTLRTVSSDGLEHNIINCSTGTALTSRGTFR